MEGDSAKRVDRFMGLLIAHQERLYRYVRMVMPHSQQIDDVLQETFLVMWQKFDESHPEASFYCWACRIAHLKVLEAYARNVRDVPVLDHDILEQITNDTLSESEAGQSDVMLFLRECLARLSQGDRELIRLRYEPGMQVNALATKLTRPANSISKSLGRIRRLLWLCVEESRNSRTTEDGVA